MTPSVTEFDKRLSAAVESFDREGAKALCEELVVHLRERDDAYPEKHAKTVLGLLRGKRYFEHMQQVADALIQNGQDAPTVRRQYAQSQIDQGNLTAAISTLEDLERDTAADGASPDPNENAEARGLLGRAYKDLYLCASNPKLSRNRRHLETAIAYYQGVYKGDPSRIWHGINSVALIRRAAADEVELETIAGPKLAADSMATEILAGITEKHLDKKADTWDFATAVEACVGLGKRDEALEWLARYLDSDYTDAFELGSTYRQLTGVWKLEAGEPPGDKILPALKGALLRRQGSDLEISVAEAAREKLSDFTADAGLEKVFGSDSFQNVRWLQTCMRRAASVVRIENKFGDPVGTGFVVRGGDLKPELGDELLILTNAHVISADPGISISIRPEQAVLDFELWENGDQPEFAVEQLWSSPFQELDATLVRPTPVLVGVEPMPMTDLLPLADGKERAYIIGHPQGRRLSFSIHDNYLLDYDERLLHYRSPTEPGSSGSPVFNADWELIGLHHKGLANMQRLHGKEGTYPANEGIWIQAIIQKVQDVDLH